MKLAKVALALAFVLAGCSSESGGDTTGSTVAAGGAGETVVEVTSIAYPTDTVVAAGGTVRWINSSGAPHTVEFDTVDGVAADTAPLDLPVDGEAEATLNPGTWIYHCGIHASMMGSVSVEG